jgi:hypothetical protein
MVEVAINSMYNEGQKAAFIAAVYPEARRAEIAGLFGFFAPYEASWEGDLVLQHINLLQPAFNEITEKLTATKSKNLLAALKKYREWYLEQKPADAAAAPGVLLLKLNLENKLRSSMVASPKHLKRILDEVFDAPERETLDCVYRGLLWLALAGVPRSQAVFVTVDEIDFYTLQIHHGGKDYEIYKEGLAEFRKLCELDAFAFIHKNPDYEQRRPRMKGNQLLRRYGDASVDIVRICNAMTQRFAGTKWSLSYENVSLCGMFYEKFELERCGQEASFAEESAQRLSEMTDSTEAALKVSYYAIPRNYRIRYNQWKSLFHVRVDED